MTTAQRVSVLNGTGPYFTGHALLKETQQMVFLNTYMRARAGHADAPVAVSVPVYRMCPQSRSITEQTIVHHTAAVAKIGSQPYLLSVGELEESQLLVAFPVHAYRNRDLGELLVEQWSMHNLWPQRHALLTAHPHGNVTVGANYRFGLPKGVNEYAQDSVKAEDVTGIQTLSRGNYVHSTATADALAHTLCQLLER
jgi:hypothetical protein